MVKRRDYDLRKYKEVKRYLADMQNELWGNALNDPIALDEYIQPILSMMQISYNGETPDELVRLIHDWDGDDEAKENAVDAITDIAYGYDKGQKHEHQIYIKTGNYSPTTVRDEIETYLYNSPKTNKDIRVQRRMERTPVRQRIQETMEATTKVLKNMKKEEESRGDV